MLKEEVMLIKERLNKDNLNSFTALNGLLEKFNLAYGICETQIRGEADNIPWMTIQSWIDRLPELTTGYELKNVWNMDELGLPEKSLVQKSSYCKGSKKSNQRFTAAFFVAADSSKEPVAVWKSRSPRCCKNIHSKARPSMMHYFSNNTAWMQAEIMEMYCDFLTKNYSNKVEKFSSFLGMHLANLKHFKITWQTRSWLF